MARTNIILWLLLLLCNECVAQDAAFSTNGYFCIYTVATNTNRCKIARIYPHECTENFKQSYHTYFYADVKKIDICHDTMNITFFLRTRAPFSTHIWTSSQLDSASQAGSCIFWQAPVNEDTKDTMIVQTYIPINNAHIYYVKKMSTRIVKKMSLADCTTDGCCYQVKFYNFKEPVRLLIEHPDFDLQIYIEIWNIENSPIKNAFNKKC